MIAKLDILSEWIPEQMHPGSLFVLDPGMDTDNSEDPYWAVLACPSCGALGLITRSQMAGLSPIICGSNTCSAQFFLRGQQVEVRLPS